MPGDENFMLEFFLGYLSWEEAYEDSDGTTLLTGGFPVNEPLGDLDSTFTFEWTAIKTGLNGEFPLGEKVKLKASFAALMNVSYYGEGYWNLRDLEFEQDGDGGTGIEVSASLVFPITDSVTIETGIWYAGVSVDDGTDEITFSDEGLADGTQDDMEDIETTRFGIFVGLVGEI